VSVADANVVGPATTTAAETETAHETKKNAKTLTIATSHLKWTNIRRRSILV
jgi:hypothetical protein